MHVEIEAYLNGELQGKALEQFELELAQNPALREEVELMRPTVRDLRLAAIARRVEEAGLNRTAKRRARRIVVLSCCVLLGFGVFWWWSFGQSNPENPPRQEFQEPLINPPVQNVPPSTPEEYGHQITQPIAKGPVKPGPASPLYRSLPPKQLLPTDGVALADTFLSTFNAVEFINMQGLNISWRRKDYAQYFETLEQIMADKGKDDTALLLQSACLLFLHRPMAAESELYRLRTVKGSVGEEAKWLLTLSYVMQGKDDSAKDALEDIADEDGPHQAEARLLLHRIRE